MPDYIEGVIDYQGRVVPIVNLRSGSSCPSVEVRDETRILVLTVEASGSASCRRRHRRHVVRSRRGRAAADALPRARGRVPQGVVRTRREARDLPRREQLLLHRRAHRARPSRHGGAGANGVSVAAATYRERVRCARGAVRRGRCVRRAEALKAEIIELFAPVETRARRARALKDEAKTLVEKWKAVRRMRRRRPHSVAERRSVADHIGASTFIEKGWSRISLGDYAGAEPALSKALQLSPNDPQAESLLGWAQMLQEKYDDALMQLPEGADARAGERARAHQRRLHLPEEADLRRGDRAPVQGHPAGQRQQGDAVRALLSRAGVPRARHVRGRADLLPEDARAGPEPIEAYFELGRALLVQRPARRGDETWRDGFAANKFNPWGKRCAEVLQTVEAGRSSRNGIRSLAGGASGRDALALGRPALVACVRSRAQDAPRSASTRGRFTAVVLSRRRAARAVAARCGRRATTRFPGLPAADAAGASSRSRRTARRFREWIGPGAPEWGAAIAFPESQPHRYAGARARDPTRAIRVEVLRHELAHLALHEALGDLPPRWFDEGYASFAAQRSGARRRARREPRACVPRHARARRARRRSSSGGSLRAQSAYALATARWPSSRRSTPSAGLTLFFRYWKETGRFETRRAQRVRHHARPVRGDLARANAAAIRRARPGRRPLHCGGVTLFIVMPFYVIRRRRDRLRMAALVRADEEAERRERESVIEALLRSISRR